MGTPIADIDYSMIARVAASSGVSFESLCAEAEVRGARTPEALLEGKGLSDPDVEWVVSQEAAKIVGTSYATFMHLTSEKSALRHYGIRSRSRSQKNPNSRRGCGVLWHRSDLAETARIRKAVGVTLTTAMKIFQAKKLGDL